MTDLTVSRPVLRVDSAETMTLTNVHLTLNTKSPVQAGMLADLAKPAGYEPGSWDVFCSLLKPGDAVIDVGAHVGVFTCLAASLVGPTGHVYAFEPDNDNRRCLKHNVWQNGFTNVTVDKRAVSHVTDRLSFYKNSDNDGGHALYNPGRHAGNTKTRANPKQRIIPTVRLDDALFDRRVKLIKIDTEGAEVNVLKGAHFLLDRYQPAVIAEVNAFGLQMMGESELTLRGIFHARGYSQYALQDVQPYRVPLEIHQTAQQSYVQNGVTCWVAFNMLFLPPP